MARDFRAKQVRTFAIIGSGSSDISANSPELRLAFYPHEMALNSVGGTKPALNLGDATVGEDVWCVFGTKTGLGPRASGHDSNNEPDPNFPNPDLNSDGSSQAGRGYGSTVLFAGNVVVSGSLYAERQIIEVDNTVNGDFLTPAGSAHKLSGGFASGAGVDIDASGNISTTGFVRTGTLKQVSGNLDVKTETSGNVAISSSGNVTIDAVDAGTINIGTSGVAASDTSDINIGTSNSARTITVGNDTDTTGTTKVDVNAIDVEIDVGTGGFTVDSKGAIDITTSAGNTGITIDPHGSGTLQLGSVDNTKVDVDALKIDIDAASTAADAVSIVSAGGVDITAAGDNGSININATEASNFSVATDAAEEDLTIALTGGTDSSIHISSTGTGTDAITMSTSAGGMDITSAGVMDITSSDAMNVTSAGAMNITTSAGDSTISMTTHGTGALTLGKTGAQTNLRGGYLDVDAAGSFNITGGHNSYVQTNTATRDMIVRAHGGGDQHLQLTSAGTSADAIHIDASAGGIDVDSQKAITVLATTEDIDITADANNAKVRLKGDNESGVSIHLDGNAAAGSIVDIDGGQVQIDASTTATITAPTSLGLDSTGAILMRDTGVHFGPSGPGAGMAALTAGNSPVRIFKAVSNLYPADMNNQSEAAFPFNGDGSNSAPSSADILANAGDLVISNRRTVDASGKATGKIVIDGAFDIQTLNVSNNLVVAGNLTVDGTATTLNTETVVVEDPIMVINAVGTRQDAGFLIRRADNEAGEPDSDFTDDLYNVAFYHDENGATFRAITTNHGLGSGLADLNASTIAHVPITASSFRFESVSNKLDLSTDIIVTAAADVTFTVGGGNVTPTANDGAALGSADKSWSDLYLADGGQILFGNDSEITLTHSPDSGLLLKHNNTSDNKMPMLTFQAGDNDIATDDELGVINFQSPDEVNEGDSRLIAAGIAAVAEANFSGTRNQTQLSFRTAYSGPAAEKMALDSFGNLSLKIDDKSLKFGANSDVTLTHVHDTGLLLNSGMQLQFGHADENISGDGTDLTFKSANDFVFDLSDANYPAMRLKMSPNSAAKQPQLILERIDGAITSGDHLGMLSFGGREGAGVDVIEGARIDAKAVGDFSISGINKFGSTELAFHTKASNALSQRMVISSGGLVGINVNAPATQLEVAGTIRSTKLEIDNANYSIDTGVLNAGANQTNPLLINVGMGAGTKAETGVVDFQKGGTTFLRFIGLDTVGGTTNDNQVNIINTRAGDMRFMTSNGNISFSVQPNADLHVGQASGGVSHKLEFNDNNIYIHQSAANTLKLASGGEIKLGVGAAGVTIDHATPQLNFLSNSSNIKMTQNTGGSTDKDQLIFTDEEHTSGVSLKTIATTITDNTGGWEYNGSLTPKAARSRYTALFNFGTTANPAPANFLSDHAGTRHHFYVKSSDSNYDLAGIESHLDLRKTLSIRDAGDADKEAIVAQDGDFTRFGHHAGNTNTTTPASRTIQKIMALKPGGAGVGGLFLEQNQSLFFSDNAADTAVNIQRVLHTVEGNADQKCMQHQGHILPQSDNAFNLGTADRRFANLYTGDLHLNNMGSSNDVDGTSGNWTIQEGEDSLYVINNLTGKKFKMMLQPIEDGE